MFKWLKRTDPLQFSFGLAEYFGLNRIKMHFDSSQLPRQVHVTYRTQRYLLAVLVVYGVILAICADQMHRNIQAIAVSGGGSSMPTIIAYTLFVCQNIQVILIVLYNFAAQRPSLGECLTKIFQVDRLLYKYSDTYVTNTTSSTQLDFKFKLNVSNLVYVCVSTALRLTLYTIVFDLNALTLVHVCLPSIAILIFRIWYVDVMALMARRVQIANQLIGELHLDEEFYDKRNWFVRDDNDDDDDDERVEPKRISKVFGGLSAHYKLDLLLSVQDECIALTQQLFGAFEGQIFINFSFEYVQVTCYTFLMYAYVTFPQEFQHWPNCFYLFLFWLFTDLYEMNIIIAISNTLIKRIKETGIFLHKLQNYVDNDELMQNITNSSLMYIHKHVTLNALGVIDINFSFIDSVIRTVVTYWVIVVQYDHTQRLNAFKRTLEQNVTHI